MAGYLRRRNVLGATATGIVGALSGCLASLSDPNGPSSDGDWRQYGHDAANTGYNPAGRVPNAESIDWRYERNGQVTTTPVCGNGLVYAGWSENRLQDGTIVACDAVTGEKRWDYDADAFLPASFALEGDVLYALSGEGVLYALDGDDGSERWSLALATGGGSAPTIVEGLLYASYSDTACVDVERETVEWTRATTTPRALAVADGAVYVSDQGGVLARVDPETGDESWRLPVDRGHLSAPVHDDGAVFVRWTPTVSDDEEPPKLVAIDTDGDERWRTDLEGDVSSADPVVANGTVYVVSFEFGPDDERGTTRLTAVDGVDGSVRWVVEEPGADATSFVGPAVVDDVVFVSYFTGQVIGYGIDDGEERWRIELGEIVQTGPVLASGMLFVGTQAGVLYAIGE